MIESSLALRGGVHELRLSVQAVHSFVLSLLFLALMISSTPAIAQSTFGAVIGTVSDTSGAVVKGASVTLVNVGTSAHKEMVTDENGSFSFINLDAGKYSLTVQAPSFQKVELPICNCRPARQSG